MDLNAPILVSAVVVSLAIILGSLLGRSNNNRRPPGPRCFPFIGSLHHLILTSEPQVALRDLAEKHGPVMYLRLGHVDTVVISSPAAAQEVLRDSRLNFASRPNLRSTEVLCYGNSDIAFAPHGAYWRLLRKLCTVELLGPRRVTRLAPIRDRETLSLVGNIRNLGRDGQLVAIGRLLGSCANSITAKATFGVGIDGELQEQFLSAMNHALEFSGGFCVGDVFPSLGLLDVVTGVSRRLWRAQGDLDVVLGKFIAGCEQKKKTGDEDDLLSILLRIRDKDEGGEVEFPITTTNIKAIIVDMFTGGTETTSSSVEWIMSELMRNPRVMANAQKEVRQVFDKKRPEEHEGHLEQLRYTRMVVKEGLRLHPVLPLLLPRVCHETCNVAGFEVTQGSRVMVNAWAIGRSPDYWGPDAHKFRPERFEDTMVDYKGAHFEYIPFGAGRRMCPGTNFGIAVLELMLARLLYYFNWSLPSGTAPDDLDMHMIVGATTKRKNHLHLVAVPRNVPLEI